MKHRYKRQAWLLDDDVLIEGQVDKRGFHPNKGIQCGFSLQIIRKKDIGNILFYRRSVAINKFGNIEVISC